MNFFEQQLRTLTGRNTAFKSTSPVYVGRAAFLTLDEHIRARIEFVTTGTADKYEACRSPSSTASRARSTQSCFEIKTTSPPFARLVAT